MRTRTRRTMALAEVMDSLLRRTECRELRSRIREGGRLRLEWGDLTADEVTVEHVRAWLDAHLSRGAAPNTAWTLKGLLSMVLHHAVELGACERNVALDLPSDALPPKEPRDPLRRALEILAPDQADAVIAQQSMWAGLLCTGLRGGEWAGLSWADLAAARPLDEILVRHSWDSHTRRLGPTKARRPRRVPMHRAVVRAVDESRAWYRDALGRAPRPDEPVFAAGLSEGRPTRWARQVLLRTWRADLEEVGVPEPAGGPRSLHATRHGFCDALFRQGVAWRVLAAMTHSVPRQSADGIALPTYITVTWPDMCRAVERLPWG